MSVNTKLAKAGKVEQCMLKSSKQGNDVVAMETQARYGDVQSVKLRRRQKRSIDCSDFGAELCPGKSLPQYLQGFVWYGWVAFPSERVKPLHMLKASRDQGTVQAIALCIAFKINHIEIAHVVTNLVRGICQTFG